MILHHRQDRPLVDTQIIVRDPALHRVDRARARAGVHESEAGIERILAAWIARLARRRVVRMDLHRQLLAGEEIFDEQVGIGVARRLETHRSDESLEGTECVSTCSSRWTAYTSTKKINHT